MAMGFLKETRVGPRSTSRKATSVPDLAVAVQADLQKLKTGQKAMGKVFQLFSSQSSILPSDCDQANRTVLQFSESIFGLKNLLYQTRLNMNRLPSHYPLLGTLYTLIDELYDLQHLIKEFRGICLEPNRQTTRQHQAIIRQIDEVLKDIDRLELPIETGKQAQTAR